MDQFNLDEIREETEWEQCSQRNRLQSLRSQLDKQLEWELKRLSLERREFSDVLENLRKRHVKIDRRNVRTMKTNNNNSLLVCERSRKHDRHLYSMNTLNGILPKTMSNPTNSLHTTTSINSYHLSAPHMASSPDLSRPTDDKNNTNNNSNNNNKQLNRIPPVIKTEFLDSTEKPSQLNVCHLMYTDSGEWIHLNKSNLNVSAPSSASKSSASSKCTKSWSEN
ncbi:unnamed protein product [Trichobilharzia szidati]|nr:unnamed protein product [Trichobilharzia szidati]